MTLLAVGLNHTTAPVELRERLAVPTERLGEGLGELQRRANLEEVMLLSTCNRVEVYAVRPGDGAPILDALAQIGGVDIHEMRAHCFVRTEDVAARHIFRVTASLESMILGEPQILGQVKQALSIARQQGTVGAVLDRCLTMAFRGAKRVRSETDIARGAASVPSVAVDLARGIFGDLSKARVLLIGAGEMSEQVGVHMRAAGATKLTVANRGEARGRALAEAVGGHYVDWTDMNHALSQADVVVASTGAPEVVVDVATMRMVMRERRGAPIFMVDIAVPRDIDPRVSSLEQVYAYDIDDLEQVVRRNMAGRADSAAQASLLVEEELDAFLHWQQSRSLAPLLQSITARAQGLADRELARVVARADLTEAERERLESLAHGIVQKFLHTPIAALRSRATDSDAADLADAARELFGLDKDRETDS